MLNKPRKALCTAARRPRQAFDLVRGLPGVRQEMGRGPDWQCDFVSAVKPSRCLITMVNGRLDPNRRRWEPRLAGRRPHDDRREIRGYPIGFGGGTNTPGMFSRCSRALNARSSVSCSACNRSSWRSSLPDSSV